MFFVPEEEVLSMTWVLVSMVALWLLVGAEAWVLVYVLREVKKLKRERATKQIIFPASPEADLAKGGLPLGQRAPNFSARRDDGQEITLDDFQGKRRILAFILPGCDACKELMETLAHMIKNDDVPVVFLIGSHDIVTNQIYATENKSPVPILTAAMHVFKDLYRVPAIPFVFLLDEEGIIRQKGVAVRYEQLRSWFETA
jgi:peroxiredoxin